MEFSQLWLGIKPLKGCSIKTISIVCKEHVEQACAAVWELRNELSELLPEVSFVRGSADLSIKLSIAPLTEPESYTVTSNGTSASVTGGSGVGILYGVFALLRGIRLYGFGEFEECGSPTSPLRMLDHWDNIDGSIERGYSGRSFFFKDGELLINERTVTYARLLASVGINACAINNVNVRFGAEMLITEKYYTKLTSLIELFGRYGIKLYICVDFSAPISVGGIATADPLDPAVQSWWSEHCAKLFSHVKGLGGFLVKADSEGRPGPYAYGRDHADGANLLAKAIAPYGGKVIWRAFVYNCSQDWRDEKTDRACSAYETFKPLDGRFEPNVILQVKNGPMDFQVREPVHPLFGAMPKTNLMAELQLTQEYTGQQKHVCYLIPMFRSFLDSRTCCDAENDSVGDVICGISAVSNTGDDFCWTGSELAAANLYGFGRLAFDRFLTAEKIIAEWCALTFEDELARRVTAEILLGSHKAYEAYTVPLGLGWMCKPNHHYGPDPWGYEFDRWGTYNRADRNAVGVDRSHSGTGYAALYNPPLAEVYDSVNRCPDELLLFFHRVPYDHRLHSGKTVIQHIYDAHFEGYEQAEHFAELWKTLEGRIDERTFRNGCERFTEQLRCAREWRDIVNTFFHRLSGIDDENGRTIYP